MTEKLRLAGIGLQTATDKMESLAADVSSEQRAATLKDLESAKKVYREAWAVESVSPAEDGETRERRELRGRVKISGHVAAAMEERMLDGPELEYNQSLGLKRAGAFPLELLAAEVEERATTNVDGQATQRPWLDRLFSETAAARIGVTFESVSPGVASFPVVTAGAVGSQRGRGEAAADAAWVVGISDLKPTRNAVRCVFSEEDTLRIPGLEESLRRDLAMALTEAVDRVVFVGDAGANEDPGDIKGLTTAANVVEKTLKQADKIKGPETLEVFASLVNGKHSNALADLRIVAAVGANTLWLSTNVSPSEARIVTLSEFLKAQGISWTVRGDLEDTTAATKFGAFLGRGRGLAGAGVAAVWNAGLLIRDPYGVSAAKGEVSLTLSYFWNFGLPRPSNFARIKFVA